MFKIISSFIITILFITPATAQEAHEPRVDSDYIKPYQPFRIAGNLYYVGTYELACYLITTTEGNILINTGTAASAAQIKNNIESLGFKFSDTKILLITQAHYDHVGALAAIQQMTGAKLIVDAYEEDVLESGGKSDYEMGKYGVSFQPVKPDRLANHGGFITLGDMQLIMLHHPGHTKGSCSYLFTVKDSARSYRVLIANMPSIITDKRFQDVTDYPSIRQDYTRTFKSMKKMKFDLWLASHASQFDLQRKHPPGGSYNPAAFMDKKDFFTELNALEKTFKDKEKKDKKG
ncbi:MAG: subclass B3 metallo-beta-lactamase [Flavisolibacter sp.]